MAKAVFTGLAEVDAKLAKLPGKTQTSILRKAMRKTAKQIQGDAKKNAPKDEGELRRSLKVRAGKRSRRRVSVNVLTDPKAYEANRVHAFLIERGTRHMAAQPFLLPAMRRAERFARAQFEQNIREVIASVANG